MNITLMDDWCKFCGDARPCECDDQLADEGDRSYNEDCVGMDEDRE